MIIPYSDFLGEGRGLYPPLPLSLCAPVVVEEDFVLSLSETAFTNAPELMVNLTSFKNNFKANKNNVFIKKTITMISFGNKQKR